MRVAGALTLITGFVIAAVLALLPVNLTVVGTSINCGVPAVRSFVTPTPGANQPYPNLAPDTARECVSQSRQRLTAGAVTGGIAVVGGMAMIRAGRPRSRPAVLVVSADWWWNGRVWISSAALGAPPGYRGPWYSGSLPPLGSLPPPG